MNLRLLKIVVQPVFVEVDDEGALGREHPAETPVNVSAQAWPEFPAELEKRRLELEAELIGDDE
jgi:hypothetical protein